MRLLKFVTALLLLLLIADRTAVAGEVTVMISGGFNGALTALAPEYQRATGNSLFVIRGPSMGKDPTSIPSRLSHGQHADVVIMVRSALLELAEQHTVKADSVTDLGVGLVALAVKSGAAKPDISTVAALKKALLDAKSVAYSDSASGVYLSTILFKRLGIADAMIPKSKMIQATPVGQLIASGDYELGFQQLSELEGIPGIDIVGVIPEEVQQRTVFSAGLVANALNPSDGSGLIRFLHSSDARSVIKASGMELTR